MFMSAEPPRTTPNPYLVRRYSYSSIDIIPPGPSDMFTVQLTMPFRAHLSWQHYVHVSHHDSPIILTL